MAKKLRLYKSEHAFLDSISGRERRIVLGLIVVTCSNIVRFYQVLGEDTPTLKMFYPLDILKSPRSSSNRNDGADIASYPTSIKSLSLHASQLPMESFVPCQPPHLGSNAGSILMLSTDAARSPLAQPTRGEPG